MSLPWDWDGLFPNVVPSLPCGIHALEWSPPLNLCWPVTHF